MQGVSVFFDTNVLVYAHDELSPFHDNSSLLLDLVINKDIHRHYLRAEHNGALPDFDKCVGNELQASFSIRGKISYR
jgi:hypothetical protein